MKFKLDQYNRDVPDDQLLSDIQQVAKKLGKGTLTREEYNRLGRFHSSTLRRRFGSWIKTLEQAGLGSQRENNAINKIDAISDLKSVARQLSRNSFSGQEYEEYGKYSESAVARKFGSWNNALEAAGLHLTKISYIKNEELFHNLEQVWIKLGRQPKYAEIEKPLSKYSSGAYTYRFGTFRKALEAFVEYINDEELTQPKEEKEVIAHSLTDKKELSVNKHKTKRNISSRLKVQVLLRDGNKCKLCGITVTGKDIHFDHKKPWSKGGETVLENLQVLCAEHNIAKGNLDVGE